ncbi:MAG: hypothetical protein H0V53_05355 [Rubrobacter sp.]|nr:hypothetical protein [Rubrobacter sp.]
MADFTIIGKIASREVIASGRGIRDLEELKTEYGEGNWRKCKGRAEAELADGTICDVEIHWYEAHGIGQKIKRVLR